jgi:hypothetical protein
MKNYNKTEPIQGQNPAPTSEQLQKMYSDEYLALCTKYGFQIAFAPQWKQSADTGTYSLVIGATLVEYKPPPQ